ncbi:MAG TPA: PSD1 and planctomycete cytochrome C domain-containing protein [Pirellulales bacterium]|nr:PSD1 and planctomycete cytochrome C domain-containing protein [Pirellulales bacterium]
MQFSARIPLRYLAVLVLASSLPQAVQADEAVQPSADQIEFFEKQIRPMLVNRCQSCHGADDQEAGLRLDSRQALLAGIEGAPVMVPGEPDKSRLIQVVRYNSDVQMPPEGKLPEAELASLTAWIKMGAPWPPSADGKSAGPAADAAQTEAERFAAARNSHWAFQPVHSPALPPVQNAAWCATPVDAFVLSQLEARGLSPSPRADRRTLLRRASFDLTGLPPTSAEIESFEHDDAPDAWARAVDRLLASSHYGQRWGRHWLDVARYADTKGYVFTQERRYPFSYVYRDYVIRAFNEDLPYDRFLKEQLAADQLPLGDDKRALGAMGFLTVGRRFSFNTHDIIDDRIDVVSRGLMGMTVTCARCHDHKFDPIPTADYYSLYGVFASSVEPDELPLIAEPEPSPEYDAFLQELNKRKQAVVDYANSKRGELETELRGQAGEYLLQLAPGKPAPAGNAKLMTSDGKQELKRPIVDRWRNYLNQSKAQQPAVFGLWHELAALDQAAFVAKATELADRLKSGEPADKPVNALVKDAFIKQPPATMDDVARLYGGLLSEIQGRWLAAAKASPAPDKLPEPAAEALRQVLYGPDSPTALSDELFRRIHGRDVRDQLTKLQRQVDEFQVNSPAAPPRAMVMNDAPHPFDPQIFVRGNPARRGAKVPRRFLGVLSPAERPPFSRGSGRLELAEAIASRDNPLTARVLVNRVWLHHFGAGLVRTPSDFGTRTDPPSHPALLDWLSASFMDQGWSIKKLHRVILLSNTYQQASHERPECAAVDPENRLLWRMNRQRLEFEAIRDAYLAAAGTLDPTLGGRPIDLWKRPFSTRRAVYGYIDRQDLPGVLRVFDFANPDVSNAQRPKTTVPQQALFAMNSPFVLDQVRRLTARAEVAGEADAAKRVQALYRLVLTRPAEPDEVELALKFIQSPPQGDQPGSKLSSWEQFAQVLLSTNEFVFVD